MRALLFALSLMAASPAAARADVLLPESAPRPASRPEPARSGCSRKPGGPATEMTAFALACTFSLLFLAGRRKPRAS